MKAFRANYHLCAPIERQRNGIDVIDLVARGTIPFVPQEGIFLISLPGDDYRKVDMVQWDCVNPVVLDIWFEDEERVGKAVVKQLKQIGWKEKA